MFTFLGKSSCEFTNFVPLGVCGLDLILPIIIIDVDTNGALITIIIERGITIKYNGTNLTSSILKFEVFT
jgi:hypothetical protein